jgi:hypothetical protein
MATSGQGKRIAHRSGEIKFDFIDVAPTPIFARLDGLNDGVFGGVEMFRGVLIFR